MSFAQHVLDPAGPHAGAIASLAWLLFAGGAAVLVLVTALLVLAVALPPARRRWLASEGAVVAGGVVFPVLTLTALLWYGLSVHRGLADDGPPAVVIDVVGEQWWWRVHYRDADGVVAVATANEIHVPVGRPVELRLSTADVIHSFWVPALAGKLDMIPGRVNRLRLRADEPGVFRGQCAEFCGGAHALMAFHVVAEPPPEFDAWIVRQAAAARVPDTAELRLGHDLFVAAGCPACHTVRGVAATGTIGPDLTHVGGRRFVAAGLLPTTADALARWIRSTRHLKPEARMPPFPVFEEPELLALARWLDSLE
jgi:cytochrome c oxidase subunit 2